MTDASADRFSELPDVLIHQIYSFLDMKEVLGTTLLSKRWRYLWCSLPKLNFDGNMWCIEGKTGLRWKEFAKFEKFVDKVLLCHDGPIIQKLCLSNNSRSRRTTLLDLALKYHVQELHLEKVSLPYTFAGEVKTLVIRGCRYPEGTFTISSSRLKYLIVENFEYSCKFCGIELRTPDLTTLQLKGDMFRGYDMGDLSALVTAEIYVHITEVYSKGREVSSSYFSAIFNGIRSVEYLTLPTHCFKFFPELSDGMKLFLISFNNVQHLKMTEWRERSYIDAVGTLLGCFPNLENLVLERTETTGDSHKGGNWEAALSSASIFCHLKAIEIQKFDGSENGCKFLEFLLDNAMVLEHITMKVTKSLSEEKVKELVNFCKKLHTKCKASLSVTIRLMMKVEGRFSILFQESSSLFKSLKGA